MNDHYLKKLDRVTAILTQLQSKSVVRAQDLAEKFDVSIRTIYRDVKTLENAGIPIVGEAGNGYSLMDGYKLPPIMFNKEEVLSFITAEKLMQKFSHQSLGNHYQTAMEKVRSVLRHSDKNLIQNIEKQIDVFNFHTHQAEDSLKNVIPIILESIAEKTQLNIEYQTVDSKISNRTIEAVGIFFEFNFWYIMAYCTLRNDFRQFRVDRILKIYKTQTPFLQEYGQIADYRKSHGNKVKAKLLVDKKIMAHLVNSKKYYGLIEEVETDQGVELTFETEWINDGFPRWVITFADYATVLEPESLRTRLKELLTNMIERHQ
ncbi:DNA-binding protein [Chryseobacterium artocarpi]|uniref:DNA-binding protein n=1 Tax=Chryseobacterium artocarpi TaxID=1414727 RepID=A0A1B8ZFS6_9FLAO|nr:YafY family protein [Chryseobacterium artocarpi]OCA70451.1 DNA-binding protein [Chryseobacterium artocarpi]